MTQEHLPVGSSGENRLPAHHDPRTAHQIGQWRGGNALSLDLQDERRDDDEIDLLALQVAGIVPGNALSAKVILSGAISRKVVLKGVGATKGAKAAIEAAGGSVAE